MQALPHSSGSFDSIRVCALVVHHDSRLCRRNLEEEEEQEEEEVSKVIKTQEKEKVSKVRRTQEKEGNFLPPPAILLLLLLIIIILLLQAVCVKVGTHGDHDGL